MKILGIIPARYASSRFPGKPLTDLRGKSMIQRVYDRCQLSGLDTVVVATDDERIYNHIQGWNGNVEMTDSTHTSGTDRCAEIAKRHTDYDIVINIQGDEPLIHPDTINQCIKLIKEGFDISTLCRVIEQEEEVTNPNVVKVTFGTNNNALYFSRSTIPFVRNYDPSEWNRHADFHKHLGIYGFTRKALLEVSQLPVGRLESIEKLEQLRWLEAGYAIGIDKTEHDSIGLDTPEQVARIESLLKENE